MAAGMYPSACCSVIDLGTQPSSNPSWKPRRMVQLVWELLDEEVEFERDGVKQRFKQKVRRMFPASLGSATKPSELRKILQSWRGRPFTDQELAGFDLKNVLGANGLLTIVHNAKNGTTYADVGSVGPLMKGMPKRTPETPLTYFSLSDVPADAVSVPWPESLLEGAREMIRKSVEYKARFGDGGDESHDTGAPHYESHDEDPIPF